MASIKERLLVIQASALATAEAAKQLLAEMEEKKPTTDKQRRRAELKAMADANMNKNFLRHLNKKAS